MTLYYIVAKFIFSLWIIEWLTKTWNGSFDWDEGNTEKSKLKHEVESLVAEEVFYDKNLAILGEQIEPLTDERRFAVVGKTNSGGTIFISFTTREQKIRVISARLAHRKERAIYEKTIH